MSKLGTKQKPAIIRVKTQERANGLLKICNENGWQVMFDRTAKNGYGAW